MATSARAGRGGDPASPSTGLGRCHQPARGRERVESTRRATDGIATTAPPGSRPVQFPHSRLKRPAGSAASFNGDLAKRLRRARGLSPAPRWRFAKSLSILSTLAVRLPLRRRGARHALRLRAVRRADHRPGDAQPRLRPASDRPREPVDHAGHGAVARRPGVRPEALRGASGERLRRTSSSRFSRAAMAVASRCFGRASGAASATMPTRTS